MRTSSILGIVILAASACQQPSATQSTYHPISAGKEIAVAETTAGKVRGYVHNTIYTYKSIPYAQAKRFMPPQPPEPWTTVRSSMTYGPVCPLMDPTTSVTDESEFVFHHDWGYPNEDCLRLNVWTPNLSSQGKRPVMVWLHGGGYVAGSSQELPSYDGERLAQSGDVVVVSINHRLNILGFLDLSAYGEKFKSSSNVGMLDVVAALEWVKANIKNFGGDPDNVTIFGQSGGGGKVNTLLNAPSAKGLFHKAIIESGGLGLRFNDQEVMRRVAAAVLEELRLTPSSVDSIQSVPFPQLAAAGKKAMAKVQEQLVAEGKPVTPLVGLTWGPTRDHAFLFHNPTDSGATADAANVPLLIGSTKNEFMPSLWMPHLRDADIDGVKQQLRQQYGDKTDDYIKAVKAAYPQDTRPTDLIDVDDLFRRSAIATADIKVRDGKAPVYMYLFTWQSPVVDGNYKALHCMEIPFVFNNIARCEEMTGGEPGAYALAEQVSRAWVNFARRGDPNHDAIPQWTPYTPDNGATMLIDTAWEERHHHDKEFLAITGESFF